MSENNVIGRCQHCGVQQFNNPGADPALDSMAHLCWKCVKPWRRVEATNSHGDTFAVGDRVRWDDTQAQHAGTIKRFDGRTALVIGGAYEAVSVDIDGLYL